MTEKEKFDWCDYYILGKSLEDPYDNAKLRTGINRFYYCSFLKSRDYLIENKIYLDAQSKKDMNSKTGKVHRETRTIFDEHPQLNISKIGKKIARELDSLHTYRKMADYDAEKPKNLKEVYKYCRLRAKIVIELLESLN